MSDREARGGSAHAPPAFWTPVWLSVSLGRVSPQTVSRLWADVMSCPRCPAPGTGSGLVAAGDTFRSVARMSLKAQGAPWARIHAGNRFREANAFARVGPLLKRANSVSCILGLSGVLPAVLRGRAGGAVLCRRQRRMQETHKRLGGTEDGR